jgi:hypothetical protein
MIKGDEEAMAEYLVTWSIDIDECDSPREAAERALLVQQTAGSLAVVFEVTEVLSRFPSDGRPYELGETVEIDLATEQEM